MKFGSANIDAIRFGSDAVSAVYLGATQVWSAGPLSRTLYFAPDITDDWAYVGNWWLDDTLTTPAGSVPTSADTVVTAYMLSNSGPQPTVANFTMISTAESYSEGAPSLQFPITVTGTATFTGRCWSAATITGNAAFANFAYNGNTVTGNATFSTNSWNYGYISGNAEFNGPNSANSVGATIAGNAVFNGATNYGNVVGDATFNDGSNVAYWIDAMDYSSPQISGTATFNGASANVGDPNTTNIILGWAEFNGASTNGCHTTINGAVIWNSSEANSVYGCTNQSANNYDDTATCENGSCCYPGAYSEPGVCDSCGIMTYNSYDSCGNFDGTFLAPANSTECDYLC